MRNKDTYRAARRNAIDRKIERLERKERWRRVMNSRIAPKLLTNEYKKQQWRAGNKVYAHVGDNQWAST